MAYQTFQRRSPYGIREPAVKPAPRPGHPDWIHPVTHLIGRLRGSKIAHGVNLNSRTEATTFRRLPGQRDYDVKLQAMQSSGDGTYYDFPVAGSSGWTTYPWPVGTNTGRPKSKDGRDVPHKDFPGWLQPIYTMPAQRYMALLSATRGGPTGPDIQRGAADGFVTISGGRPDFSLDFQKPPWRVPFVRKTGLGLMAGPSQIGLQQVYSGLGGCALMAPPAWSAATRGTRGVSGILQRVQGPGRSRVPATFVPREVR